VTVHILVTGMKNVTWTATSICKELVTKVAVFLAGLELLNTN
jgi:hypothetical protein